MCFFAPRSTCLGSTGLIKLRLSSHSPHIPRIHESEVIFQSRLRNQLKCAPSGLLGTTQKKVIRFRKPKENTEKAKQGQVAFTKGSQVHQPVSADKAAFNCMPKGQARLCPPPLGSQVWGHHAPVEWSQMFFFYIKLHSQVNIGGRVVSVFSPKSQFLSTLWKSYFLAMILGGPEAASRNTKTREHQHWPEK